MIKRRTSSRAKIFDAALSLLDEYPFETITVDKIIEVSGVAKQTYYNHFATKQDVYVELSYKELFERTKNNVDDACAKYSVTDKRLERFFQLCESSLKKDGHIERALMKEGLLASATPDKIAPYMIAINEELKHLIAPAIEGGELREDTPLDFCIELIAGTLSNLVINWTNIPNYRLTRNRKLYTRVLVESLLKQ
jgi:AcrR family transcriptional regulator